MSRHIRAAHSDEIRSSRYLDESSLSRATEDSEAFSPLTEHHGYEECCRWNGAVEEESLRCCLSSNIRKGGGLRYSFLDVARREYQAPIHSINVQLSHNIFLILETAMETLDGSSWDILLVGTGFQQSLLAL